MPEQRERWRPLSPMKVARLENRLVLAHVTKPILGIPETQVKWRQRPIACRMIWGVSGGP
jgi:hypothetical protein